MSILAKSNHIVYISNPKIDHRRKTIVTTSVTNMRVSARVVRMSNKYSQTFNSFSGCGYMSQNAVYEKFVATYGKLPRNTMFILRLVLYDTNGAPATAYWAIT